MLQNYNYQTYPNYNKNTQNLLGMWVLHIKAVVRGSETLWWLRFEQWVYVYLWFSNATNFKTWVLLITLCKLVEFYPLPHVFTYQYIINLTNTIKESPFYNPLIIIIVAFFRLVIGRLAFWTKYMLSHFLS